MDCTQYGAGVGRCAEDGGTELVNNYSQFGMNRVNSFIRQCSSLDLVMHPVRLLNLFLCSLDLRHGLSQVHTAITVSAVHMIIKIILGGMFN